MSQTQLASMRLGAVFLGDDRDVKPRKPMQRILIADGQTGEILDYITFKNIISDTHKKSLEDSLETFNFITFGDKRFSQFLEKRNRIIIPDEDGNLAEFVPFETPKYRDSEGHKIQVFAHGSYLELKKASVINPGDYTGTATQHLGRALNNSGWRAGIVESGGSRTIRFDNHTNPFAYIKRIARELELEPNFRVEHDGSKITGRYVDLLEQSGEWRNRTVEFGKDLDGIRRVEKQDIYTALLGIMPEDEEGNQRTVLVEDEEALRRWGRIDEFGELQHLIGKHEIQSTRMEMTEAEAIQYTRTELDKRINTVITYEAEIVDLEHVPGMENKKIRHGDTIRIKDMKFNPPLYLEARVFESEGSIKERGNKKVKLGDFVEFAEDEVNAIWNQLKNQIRNRITAAELADYTYNKIIIDSKDNAVRSDVESYANTVSSEAKEEAIIYTNNTIEPIVVSVGNLSDSIDDIESDVLDHANQITQAQTDITQAWDEINLKAEKTEVDLIESRVSTAESVLSVQAGKIEAKADSTVVDAYGVRIGSAETSIDGLNAQIVNKAESDTVDAQGQRLGVAETKIDGLETSITNFVELSVFNGLETRVDSAEQKIEPSSIIQTVRSSTEYIDDLGAKVTDGEVRSIFTQEADSFTFQADQINFDGHVFGGNATFTGKIQGAEILGSTIKQQGTNKYIELNNDGLFLKDNISNIVNMQIGTGDAVSTVIAFEPTENQFRFWVGLDGGHGHLGFTEFSTSSSARQLDIKNENGDINFSANKFNFLTGELVVAGDINATSGRLYSRGIRNDTEVVYIGDGKGISSIGGGNAAVRIGTTDFNGTGQSSALMYFGRDGAGERLWSPSIYNRPYSAAANMHITDIGTIGRSTSARKYKTDIEPIQTEYAYNFFDNVHPVFYRPFNTADENKEYSYYGYIADDVVPIEPRLVQFKDGEPESFNYDRVPALLHVVLKNEIQRIDALETENQLLKNEIKIIREQIT